MSNVEGRRLSAAAGESYSLAAFGIRMTQQQREWFASEITRSALVLEDAARAAGPLNDIRMQSFDALIAGRGLGGE